MNLKSTNMPRGVFSQLIGSGFEVGTSLVADSRIRAVGFTGSRRGGLAILNTSNSREVPIPVYAEMSSINPVILFPGALKTNGATLGSQLDRKSVV